ncbi:serine hydrolase domain-containing protein [Maricaulis maris]|uniref:serine hydrolase domain-containing protein n=1 Tax=Maricaulis maris TaxID=74318 RepID=UPI003B8CE9EC
MSRVRGQGYPFLRLALGFVVAASLAIVLIMRLPWEPPDLDRPAAGFEPAIAAQFLDDNHNDVGVHALSMAFRQGYGGAPQLAVAGEGIDTATVFEAASLSKPVTAWAVLRLAQQGRIDLDALIEENGYTFTLRDILHHAGGFDNALGLDPEPVSQPGAFRYAGQGFIYLADVIETVTGTDFATHMNTVVLPELGMTDSRFGAAPESDLALPAVDAGMVLAFVLLGMAMVFVPSALVLGGISAGLRLERGLVMTACLALITTLAAGAGVLAALALPGLRNLWTVGLPAGLFALLVLTGFALIASRARPARWLAALPLGLLLVVGVARAPLDMVERPAIFLAPAGLRTTAGDYLTFLDTVTQTNDPVLVQMLGDLVPVQGETAWGLGIAVETGDIPALWHWGINYPGYQAFAIAWPESGDIAVILMAGGEMSFSPDGMRYSGLELAIEALADAGAPLKGRYWQGIQ